MDAGSASDGRQRVCKDLQRNDSLNEGVASCVGSRLAQRRSGMAGSQRAQGTLTPHWAKIAGASGPTSAFRMARTALDER